MQTQSKSAHMHTISYSNMEALQATKVLALQRQSNKPAQMANMEALQATKVLAHYENLVEKYALQTRTQGR